MDFSASEPFDLNMLERVTRMDTLQNHDLYYENWDTIYEIRSHALDMIQNITQSAQRSYFLALMIIDLYIVNNTDYDDLELVTICALILSSYINEVRPLSHSQFKESWPNLDIKMREILNMLDYNLHFSTEQDYLHAMLPSFIQSDNAEYNTVMNQIEKLLIQASYSEYFRLYMKEYLVRACIVRVVHDVSEELYYEVYYNLGIIDIEV